MRKVTIAPLAGQPLMRSLGDSHGSKPTLWTLGHNGVNSYSVIEEWLPPGDFQLKLTPGILDTSRTHYLLGTAFSSRRYVRVDGTLLHLGLGNSASIKTGITVVPHKEITVTVFVATNTWKAEHNGDVSTGSYSGTPMSPITFGKAPTDSSQVAKGQFYNVQLRDLRDASNNRCYPLLWSDEHMPSGTRIPEILQGSYGTMFNFGTDNPFVELIR